MRLDRFSSLDDLKAKDRNDDDKVLACLRLAKRFSCFEASEYQTLARTLERLSKSGRLKTDNSRGYPWINVVEIDGESIRA